MYRKAKCIELYDLGTALVVKDQDYGDRILTGRSEWGTYPAYKIRLVDLYYLGSALGAPARGLAPRLDGQDQIGGRENGTPAKDYEINILRHLANPANDPELNPLDSLEVDVLGIHQVAIRATSHFEDGAPYVEYLTYAGPFTVWWVDDGSQGMTGLFAGEL